MPAADRPDIDPDIRPDLGVIQGGGEGDGVPRGDLQEAEQGGGLYNPDDGGAGGSAGAAAAKPGSSKSASSDDLKNSEETGGGNSLYNPNDRGSRLQKARSRARSLTKNKWLAGAALGSVGVIAIIIIILLLVGGAYKVVNFAEHVAAYQFARTTSQMAADTEQITAEKIGVDSADQGLRQRIEGRVATAAAPVKDLWSKLDKYRPNQVIQNFQDEGTMQFNYERGSLGRQVLKGVTINTHDLTIENHPIKNKLIPGYKFATRDVPLSRDFVSEMLGALKANDIGPITRARIASQVRQELNISLVAWAIGKYAGKDLPKSAAQLEEEAYNVAKGSQAPNNPKVPDTINKAAAEGDAAIAHELSTELGAQTLASQADSGQLPDSAINAIDSVITAGALSSVESALQTVISIINPIYAVATPLCLIYDGSLTNSGSTIDNQSQQLERSGVWVQTASAQEKDGSNVNGEAVGATDWKLGDITKSNAERRASGQAIDTSSFASTQASPTGQYSLSIADVGLGSTVGGFVDSVAQSGVCSALTNLWVAAGVGAISIAALVPRLISAPFLAGGEEAANTSIKALAGRLVDKAIAGKAFAGQFAKDTVKTGVAIGGATLVAKLIVMSQMGAMHNSLASGPSYDNDVDSGTNIYANQVNQQQFYGAPLTDKELGPDNAASQKYLADQESQKSTFERYASVHNPNSLLSRTALMTSGYLNTSVFSSLTHLLGLLLNPLRYLGAALSPLINHTSFAAATVTSANTYYGNVQFGYTQAEKNLMNNDPSYGMIENQLILDHNGPAQEDLITAKYGKCFDGSESIGDMLANGDIQRDSNGDVIPDKGLCAPDNVSFNSPDPLAADDDPGSPNAHDMIFRWRVSHNYNNAIDQLGQMQEVTSNGAPPTGPTVSGDSQQLAQQVLDNNKVSKTGRYVTEDLSNTAAGKPAYGSVNISLNILQFLAELGNTTSYTITSITGAGSGHSSGSNHYSGNAVDLGCPMDESKADEVAKKYGLMAQNERCENTPGNEHMHYSKDGY